MKKIKIKEITSFLNLYDENQEIEIPEQIKIKILNEKNTILYWNNEGFEGFSWDGQEFFKVDFPFLGE